MNMANKTNTSKKLKERTRYCKNKQNQNILRPRSLCKLTVVLAIKDPFRVSSNILILTQHHWSMYMLFCKGFNQ